MMLAAAMLLCLLPAQAQNNAAKIAEHKRTIADLEKKIKDEERNLSRLKNDKSTAQERIGRLNKQIALRKDLLDANERSSRELQQQMARTDSTVNAVQQQLNMRRRQYAEMVRETYRNYRHDSYMSFLLSSGGLQDLARRLAVLREVSQARAQRIAEIGELESALLEQRTVQARRSAELDSVRMKIRSENDRMQRDINTARATVRQLSAKEKQALKNKSAQEQRLKIARSELQRLSQGNTVGNTFSKKSKIDVPVVSGTVRRIVGDVCEVVGRRGARVNSVWDGKVIAVRRADNRYEVYIAHGERVSSYSNLSEVSVGKGQNVKRNQQIGVIGSWVNPLSSEPEYKILFQIQSPSGKEQFSLKSMF